MLWLASVYHFFRCSQALGVYHFFRDEPVNVTSGIVAPERLVEAGAIRTALTIFLVSAAAPYPSCYEAEV